jgi:ABC-2 type transport system ATP-binding protein
MHAPTTGSIERLGAQPAARTVQLARVGYVAQDTPIYASLSVADHLRLGVKLNPGWDAALAQTKVKQGEPFRNRARTGTTIHVPPHL